MRDLDDAGPDAGGKAWTLARARRAGLPVPDGFVLLPDDELDPRDLAARCLCLGPGPFAVRSSADLEDRAGLSAAGVFTSEIGVAAEDVAEAAARVRASALGEPVRAYLGARGLAGARARMSVLVQPVVAARALGVLHTAPVEDDAFAAEERDPAEPEWGEVRPRRVEETSPLGRLARRLADLVGGDADIEYALTTDDRILLLQARPLTAPARGREPHRWRAEGRLRRDAEHNPEPLSAAQISLVDLLNSAPGLPRQVVLHGYLFFDETFTPAAPAIPIEDLPARFAAELEPACAARLAPLEAGPPDDAHLDDALAAFVYVATRYFGEVSPALRAARRRLDELLQRSIGEPLAAHAALLAGTGGRTLARDSALRALGTAGDAARPALLARYLAAFGAYAPAWDVAVAPDDEDEARVLAAARLVARGPAPEARHVEALAAAEAAHRRVADRMPPADRAALAALLPTVHAAATLVEDDDVLFFRAQRAVRRPLLARGRHLAAAGRLDTPPQIFDLPIDDVRADRIDAGRARGLRALREGARRLSPPITIRDGVPAWRGASAGAVLAGHGTAGRGFGRAFVLADPASAPPRLPPGAVLIAEAILPSLTYLLPGAAGLVTDHGGALSHAATLAREYGVPAVLGCGLATRAIAGGEELLVDGDAGRVYRLGGG